PPRVAPAGRCRGPGRRPRSLLRGLGVGVGRGWLLGAWMVSEAEFADLHLVACAQHGGVDAFPVDVGAVEGADVAYDVTLLVSEKLRMTARDGHVIKEDVG